MKFKHEKIKDTFIFIGFIVIPIIIGMILGSIRVFFLSGLLIYNFIELYKVIFRNKRIEKWVIVLYVGILIAGIPFLFAFIFEDYFDQSYIYEDFFLGLGTIIIFSVYLFCMIYIYINKREYRGVILVLFAIKVIALIVLIISLKSNGKKEPLQRGWNCSKSTRELKAD